MKRSRQAIDPEVESKSAFAARVGLSCARISQFVARGLPLDGAGKVRITDALRWLREEIKPKGGRPLGSTNGAGSNADPDLEAAKIRLTSAQADRAELELAARRGELVPVEDARRAIQAFASVARTGWLNAAARQGMDLAEDIGVDHRVVIPALEKLIRNVLNEIAKTPAPVFGKAKEETLDGENA